MHEPDYRGHKAAYSLFGVFSRDSVPFFAHAITSLSNGRGLKGKDLRKR
jgi:hypothetical protein